MRCAMSAPVVVLALAMAACGDDEDEPAPPASDEEQIVAAVNDFHAALNDGDGESACSYLTDRGQRLMLTLAGQQFPTDLGEAADCEAVVAVTSEFLADDDVEGPSEHAYVADNVHIDEGRDRAQVQCEFRGAIFVRRIDAEWLVDVPTCID